jgi:hypothetical protein
LEQRLSSEEQQKWVTKILGYDFEIIYKKGKQNVVADALSRKDEDVEAFLYAISIIQPDWIIEARDEWKNDEKVWTLIQRLQQDSSASNTFTWKNDSLWYKYCLYLCKKSQLKQKVLLEFHTSPVGGNSGFLKTYHRVKNDFFWGMALKLMFKGLWQNVWFANKIRWKQLRPQVFYNHYPSQVSAGRRFPWISSQGYQSLKERVSSW